jgi:hypothetical protein
MSDLIIIKRRAAVTQGSEDLPSAAICHVVHYQRGVIGRDDGDD